jgi:hypothetical protein
MAVQGQLILKIFPLAVNLPPDSSAKRHVLAALPSTGRSAALFPGRPASSASPRAEAVPTRIPRVLTSANGALRLAR